MFPAVQRPDYPQNSRCLAVPVQRHLPQRSTLQLRQVLEEEEGEEAYSPVS